MDFGIGERGMEGEAANMAYFLFGTWESVLDRVTM
jgi:hypothetical protein